MGVLQQKHIINPESKLILPEINNNFVQKNAVSGNIGEFYKDSKILVTGGTGFLGKALVEKLLTSCDQLDSIYLLMRPKKGLSIDERLKQLFQNSVFDRIRGQNTAAFDKVKTIQGDVSLPNLGLSISDRTFLIDNIDIVFHSAATVKFNEDLKNALVNNTLGTKRTLQLCKKMKHLKSCVHVSTAYSNSDKENIEETVYNPPYDLNAIINCMDILPPASVDDLSKQLLGTHPNTYTLTKSMAEYIVLENWPMVPSAIVRPSIITAAWKEPFPGWVDNVSGITGIFMECGRGTIKTIICDEKCRMDLIPVDIAVNTLITAAWHTVAYRSNSMRVYNCTSGEVNPISWRKFGELTHKYSLEYPSKYVTWYPGFTYRTNRIMHLICAILFHTIPAAILDILLYFTGQKPMMLKISRKFYSALLAGSFFSTNQWNFRVTTMKSLVDAVKDAKDRDSFQIDLNDANDRFDWDQYVRNFIIGVRKYVLKDDMSSLPQAKIKLNRLYWLQKCVMVVMICLILKLLLSFI